MYHTKKIGVFISHIMGFYQKNVCQGIIDKALEYGYTAEIFTTLDGENLGEYDAGEESILEMPNYGDFSGILFASGTYVQPRLKERLIRVLKERCSCPIVELSAGDPLFPAVILENHEPIADLTRHLIEAHHCKRICYLGCAPEPVYSNRREGLYRRELERAGLVPGPEDVFSCGYTPEEAQAALSFFTACGKPDAVVCYNDALALLFMMAAMEAGYRIPEELAVTGCDCTEEGANARPPLTSVTFPVYELGCAAVEKLLRLLRGAEEPFVTEVMAKPVFKSSCGCQSADGRNALFFSHSLNRRIASLETSILTSMRMSAAFQHVTDIDEGMELLEQYVRQIDRCSAFYLCLYSGWDISHDALLELTASSREPQATSAGKQPPSTECQTSSDEILLKLALRNGRRLPECSFRKASLLPEHIYQAADSAYIYMPLFFEERTFGYVALAYEDNLIDYHFQLVHWFMNINQMIQRICGELHASLLTGRLEELSIRDPLTGLYNAQGLALYGGRLLADAQASGETALRIRFLADCAEGDGFALQVAGQALSAALGPSDLCARTGEREFVLLARGLTEKDAEELSHRVNRYLKHYSRLSHREQAITMTCQYETASGGSA